MSAAALAPPLSAETDPATTSRNRGFLVSPTYDLAAFILAPLISLLAGLLVAWAGWRDVGFDVLGVSTSPPGFFIAAFIHAHLGIVFVRSHLNPAIFKTHPWRFTAVPAAVLALIVIFPRLRAAAVVLGVLWDVYHSAQQTFGLGRIYDRLQGNDAHAGRTLDMLLNQLVYTGPILGGVSIVALLQQSSGMIDAIGSAVLSQAPAFARAWRPWAAVALLGVGIPFIAFYVLSYWRLARRGYRVSKQKVALYAVTSFCTLSTWSLDPFGIAYFANNLFHNIQYFGLVAWSEKSRLDPLARSGAGREPASLARSLAVLLLVGFGYGLLAVTLARRPFASGASGTGILFCVTVCVSLMHLWYDGFIWSVRKGQV